MDKRRAADLLRLWNNRLYGGLYRHIQVQNQCITIACKNCPPEVKQEVMKVMQASLETLEATIDDLQAEGMDAMQEAEGGQ